MTLPRDPAASDPDDYVASPCIRICQMDAARQYCTGCYRTIGEITAWGGMDAAGRRAILADLPNRRPSTKPASWAFTLPPRPRQRR